MSQSLPSHDQILAEVGRYRTIGRSRPRGVDIVTPGPGQESVWDFPRPPAVQDAVQRLRVEWHGEIVAETVRGLRIVETAGAPVYYFPPQDVLMDCLVTAGPITLCEWKGAAVHYNLHIAGAVLPRAAFAYPDPLTDLGQSYDRIAGWPAFYASRVDRVWVGDEQARPQPGGFYAGWVTDALTGPIKGEPGTEGW